MANRVISAIEVSRNIVCIKPGDEEVTLSKPSHGVSSFSAIYNCNAPMKDGIGGANVQQITVSGSVWSMQNKMVTRLQKIEIVESE